MSEARAKDGRLDLTRLPAPPKTMRTIALGLMALTGLLSAWLAIALAPETIYALSERSAVEVHDLAAQAGPALENRYVRAPVQLSGDPIRFRRLLDTDSHQAQAAGPGIWVVYQVPASMEGPRFVPPTLASGRLVSIDSLGPRFRGLGSALGGGKGWVLLDGEDPASVSWIAGLELLLLGFVAWSTWSIARVLRRPR